MTTEIIGMVGTKEVSESRGSFDGPPVDPAYLARFAQAHEAAGFDRVLIGYHATGAVEQAVALIGNSALTRKNPLERHLRNVLCARVHTPQDDSILSAAGRSALATHRSHTTTIAGAN